MKKQMNTFPRRNDIVWMAQYYKNTLLTLALCVGWFVAAAQATTDVSLPETHHYAVEVAGIRVGTMTAIRQSQPNNQLIYTLISDVKVNLLVYTVKVYYKCINQFDGKKLMLSTVETHTNKGDFSSRTEWKGDHYDIEANQNKYQKQATERASLEYPLTSVYFSEPAGRARIYSEYFGDYFTFSRSAKGAYKAVLNDHEDDYYYENGRLVKVIKHNSLKNFVIRLLD